jgi:tRNA pseudouridine38-40 synthase
MINRYFIKLSFDGTHYHGWQAQDNSLSIQAVLNNALSVVLKKEISATGAGRTDAGVHAKEFYAHFDTDLSFDDENTRNLIYHLNGFLPEDIAIQNVFNVPDDAHARFSAISRTYQYIITPEKDPFLTGRVYRYSGPLDIDQMNRGADILKNCSDFTSFAKLPSDTKTNICRVTEAHWCRKNGQIVFTVTADRFLRNMVRAIVGTLIDLGRNRIKLEDIETIILAKDRSAAGYSVPACGLYLISIRYPESSIS